MVVHGLPVLSAQPGQFLLKNLVLIGVALWTLGESLQEFQRRKAEAPSLADRHLRGPSRA